MKCVECDCPRAKYEDPSDPPVEEGECLCKDCYIGKTEMLIDDMESEIEELKESIAGLKKYPVVINGSMMGPRRPRTWYRSYNRRVPVSSEMRILDSRLIVTRGTGTGTVPYVARLFDLDGNLEKEACGKITAATIKEAERKALEWARLY